MATGLPDCTTQRLVVLERSERRDDRVEGRPAARGLAGSAVHDEILRALGDVRIQIVHQHPEGGFLRPALAGERRAPRGADETRGHRHRVQRPAHQCERTNARAGRGSQHSKERGERLSTIDKSLATAQDDPRHIVKPFRLALSTSFFTQSPGTRGASPPPHGIFAPRLRRALSLPRRHHGVRHALPPRAAHGRRLLHRRAQHPLVGDQPLDRRDRDEHAHARRRAGDRVRDVSPARARRQPHLPAGRGGLHGGARADRACCSSRRTSPGTC